MRGSWTLATGLSALALTAAACGTTVPLSEQSRTQSGSTGLSDGTGATGLAAGPGTGSQLGPTTGAGSTSGSSAGTAGGATSGSGTTTGAASSGAVQPPTGVTPGGPSRGSITIG